MRNSWDICKGDSAVSQSPAGSLQLLKAELLVGLLAGLLSGFLVHSLFSNRLVEPGLSTFAPYPADSVLASKEFHNSHSDIFDLLLCHIQQVMHKNYLSNST